LAYWIMEIHLACKYGCGNLQVHPKAQEQDGNKINLDLQTVFDKLVTRKRGGYCFEQNTLIAAVLTTMGFRSLALAPHFPAKAAV
jgi:hypothetical protein